MTDVTDDGTPAEAIHAAAVVIHRSRCAASCQHKPDRASTAVAMVALDAAAPFIAAEALKAAGGELHRRFQLGVAAQREADIKLARDEAEKMRNVSFSTLNTVCAAVLDDFADLLAAAPPATPQPPAPEERPPDAHHGER